jgi:2-polyprenyl-3-methyl-5-hydroxy-6-metoxy-1,4-benzoquinol methylase
MLFDFYKLNFKSFYFKKKKVSLYQNFANNLYWSNYKKFKDPDGKIRDLSKEFLKKKKDLRNEISFLKEKFNNKKIKVLDMGCGFNFFLKSLPKDWNKYGIELSSLVSKDKESWSKIYNYDIEKIFTKSQKIQLGKFDVIFNYHVIEHLRKPENFLINVRSLLKEKGYFLLGTPNFDSGCARRYKSRYRFLKDPTHISYFSENSLYRMLDTYGFKILRVDFPYFETQLFNINNLKKLFKTTKNNVSPPFYGNIMTFYCQKKSINIFLKELRFKKKIFKKISSKNY